MTPTGRRYPKEEFARRGRALYTQVVLPHLKPKDKGKYVVIDIETGEYEIDKDEMAAGRRLRARLPDPQPWLERVGYPTARRFGGHKLPVKP